MEWKTHCNMIFLLRYKNTSTLIENLTNIAHCHGTYIYHMEVNVKMVPELKVVPSNALFLPQQQSKIFNLQKHKKKEKHQILQCEKLCSQIFGIFA